MYFISISIIFFATLIATIIAKKIEKAKYISLFIPPLVAVLSYTGSYLINKFDKIQKKPIVKVQTEIKQN
ncbi:MAG: hypothetical protein PF545_01550 [Elusimicrobia bacterium]|jgi:amino acid permease|nr:hypothetical protein [Elusimicrobiota bacterium]